MRDKNGYVTKIETPDEFIQLFTEQPWEFDYTTEDIKKLLISWLMKYQNTIKNLKIIYNNILEGDYDYESELLDDLLYIENNDLKKWDE